jgi:glycopeptide antibiotics resistance protein
MEMRTGRRHLLGHIGLLALTIALGLGSRRFGYALPGFVASYAGDTLWALALFLFLGLILPGLSTGWVAVLALVVSLLVELSQLYHAPWIDSARQTMIGGLILGFGFLWSDLVCYAAGVGLGVALERMAAASHRRR